MSGGHCAAFGTQEVADRNTDLVEEEFRCIGGQMTELVEVAAMPEARSVGFDEDQAHTARSALRIGASDHNDEIAHLAVRDEGLLARDDIVVAVKNRARSNALQVAAGPRLGHGNRADGLAGDHAWQPFLFLLLRAVADEIAAADVIVDREIGCGTREAGISEFLDDNRVVTEVTADTAVLLGHLGAKQAGAASRRPQRAIDDPGLFPLLKMRFNP
jgi:hypothetical protein